MGRDCFELCREAWQDGVRRLPPRAPVHPPSPFLIALVLIVRPVPPVRSSLVCNQSQLVPVDDGTSWQRRDCVSVGIGAWDLSERRLGDTEFVLVSFWGWCSNGQKNGSLIGG